jgi:NADH-quinone oxidoreductase subunit M
MFGISVLMFSKFQNIDGFQFLVNVPWNTDLGISYKVGIDGINIFLVMITTFFIPVAILSTWDKIKEKERVFYSSILMLESFLIGSVVSIDLFLFYVFCGAYAYSNVLYGWYLE